MKITCTQQEKERVLRGLYFYNKSEIEAIEFEIIRWRAKPGEEYWYIADIGDGCKTYSAVWWGEDNRTIDDNHRFDTCNYFRAEQQAQAMLDKIQGVLKQG